MDPRFADKLKTPMFGGQGFFQSKSKSSAATASDADKKDEKIKKKKGDDNNSISSSSNNSSSNSSNDKPSTQEEDGRKAKKTDKHKVEIDKRFQGVLTEARFGGKNAEGPGLEASTVDQYGRKKKTKTKAGKSGNEGAELSEFYTLGEDGDSVEKLADQETKGGAKQVKPVATKGKVNTAASSKTDIESRLDYLNKLARGEISASGSDSDDDGSYSVNSSGEDSGAEDNSDMDVDGEGPSPYMQIPGDSIDYGDATSRIAIQNCDWENIGATDLFAILQSFCPSGKLVKNLTIYLSDFGKERLAIDERYGPRHIWKNTKGSADKGSDSENDDSENDEINSDDEDDSSSDSQDASDGEEGEKSYDKGDFERKAGEVGIVIQDADDNDQGGSNKKSKKALKNSDINQDKLREYELSKLRYYFAVANCDCLETASVLYEQLDGLEMEHSSMVLDLRYVPDDVSFEGRTIKGQCNSLQADYEPSEFVINALQRTSVDCSWEDGDNVRNEKLTTLSSWKTLKESDFQQYLASSDSEDDDDVDDEEKRRRAKNLRKLIGGGGEDDSDAGDEEDSFFLKESSRKLVDKFQEKTIVVHDQMDDEGGDEDVEETVFEAAKRKLAEKKKQKKLLKQQKKGLQGDDDEDDNIVDTLSSSKKGKDVGKGKGKGGEVIADEEDVDRSKKVKDKLDLMFADDNEPSNNYDMIEILKREKDKSKKNRFKKSKSSKDEDASAQDSFRIDATDPRFSRLYSDHTFGIDTTSAEFKKTSAMMDMVKHVSANRQQSLEDRGVGNKNDESARTSGGSADVKSLVNKLKRKFKDQ